MLTAASMLRRMTVILICMRVFHVTFWRDGINGRQYTIADICTPCFVLNGKVRRRWYVISIAYILMGLLTFCDSYEQSESRKTWDNYKMPCIDLSVYEVVIGEYGTVYCWFSAERQSMTISDKDMKVISQSVQECGLERFVVKISKLFDSKWVALLLSYCCDGLDGKDMWSV